MHFRSMAIDKIIDMPVCVCVCGQHEMPNHILDTHTSIRFV